MACPFFPSPGKHLPCSRKIPGLTLGIPSGYHSLSPKPLGAHILNNHTLVSAPVHTRTRPTLSSYLHYYVGPRLRAIFAGREVGGSMESDHDDLLIGRRQVAGDRFHSLGGVWGALWALGDLWREPGLSGLFLLPPGTSCPLLSPLQVAISLCHSPTQSGTMVPKGQLSLTPFSSYLCPTAHISPFPFCLSPGPGSTISCRMRGATSPFKSSPTSKP